MQGVARVIGGDFNTGTAQPVGEGIEALLSAAGLARVPTTAGTRTVIRPNHRSPQVIDHVYLSKAAVVAEQMQVGRLPPPGSDKGAWGPASEHNGSDHAWLSVEVQVGAGNPP